MPIVYATISDVAAAPGANTDDDTEAMLEFASDLVRRATQNDYYWRGPDELPRKDFIREAFKDATVAQVISWQLASITLADLYAGAGSLSISPTKKAIGSGDIERDPAALAIRDKARLDLITKLCNRSYTILRNVNLATSVVGLW